MKRLPTFLCALALVLISLWCNAQEKPIDQLESEFRNLPSEARRLTGPLFWLHGDESKERLEMYVGKVAEGGNGSFTAESRPHNDWLGPNWYRDLDICLKAAKEHDLKMWIFDEKWWPSGEVGGKVPPRYGAKRLVAISTTADGPTRIEEGGYLGPNFIAVVAGKEDAQGIDGATLIDLSHYVTDGILAWSVPAGRWKVMKFSWEHAKGRRILVDGASKDCADWYIQTVYQPHYDRFAPEFGKAIQGFFYDEPETPGDWGTELPRMLAESNVDWKRAYVAWKFKLAGEDQAAARYEYQHAFAEAWGRTLFGGVQRWCREHKVRSIGHFLEHGNEYLRMDLCAGNMFQLQKYSDMGAIDAVFDQFVMGKRITHDNPVWQTPKIASSISHVYGKADDIAMVEIFGARGQSLTYPEMKWWADHMQVSGANFLIPHSFNPKSPNDTDCPPYFYNSGFEPRWPLYRVFADYTSRLSVMLSGGRHVCPVALLNLGGSYHVGKSITPEQMSEALQDALYDCDWLPYDAFENDAKIVGNELALHQERYRVLVVPAAEVIPYATAAKIRAFLDAGGAVIAYGILPSKSATLGKTGQEIAALLGGSDLQPSFSAAKVTPTGGRFYFLPAKPSPEDLQKVLAESGVKPVAQVMEGQTDHWVHALHRVRAGRDLFFITNQNHTGEARKFRFKLAAPGEPECWDAMRDQITSVRYTREGESVLVDLTLEPLESVLIVFQAQKRPLPPRIEGALVGQAIALVRDPSLAIEPKMPLSTQPTPGITRSPIAAADPFDGHCDIPANINLAESRVYLELDTLAPEQAARVTVNGQYAGGIIGKPLHLDITDRVKGGVNVIRIEPFAPKSARLILTPR